MLTGPNGVKQPAMGWAWMTGVLLAAALAAGATALLHGQQPVAAATNPAQTSPAQTNQDKPNSAAAVAADGAQNQQVAQQTADLLKLAIDLKTEMDRTKPATLSLAVVRKASEIEQLAKKMRTQP